MFRSFYSNFFRLVIYRPLTPFCCVDFAVVIACLQFCWPMKLVVILSFCSFAAFRGPGRFYCVCLISVCHLPLEHGLRKCFPIIQRPTDSPPLRRGVYDKERGSLSLCWCQNQWHLPWIAWRLFIPGWHRCRESRMTRIWDHSSGVHWTLGSGLWRIRL